MDYTSLQRLIRQLVFDTSLPGEFHIQRSAAALSMFLTHEILSVHYPVHKVRAAEASACTVVASAAL